MRKVLSVVVAMVLLIALAAFAWAGNVKAGEEQKFKKSPQIVQKVSPVYPPEAKEKGIEGEVKLDLIIDEKGDVVEAKVSPSCKADPLLGKAAIEAVKQWKYQPAIDAKGRPVRVKCSVILTFKIKQNPAKKDADPKANN